MKAIVSILVVASLTSVTGGAGALAQAALSGPETGGTIMMRVDGRQHVVDAGVSVDPPATVLAEIIERYPGPVIEYSELFAGSELQSILDDAAIVHRGPQLSHFQGIEGDVPPELRAFLEETMPRISWSRTGAFSDGYTVMVTALSGGGSEITLSRLGPAPQSTDELPPDPVRPSLAGIRSYPGAVELFSMNSPGTDGIVEQLLVVADGGLEAQRSHYVAELESLGMEIRQTKSEAGILLEGRNPEISVLLILQPDPEDDKRTQALITSVR